MRYPHSRELPGPTQADRGGAARATRNGKGGDKGSAPTLASHP